MVKVKVKDNNDLDIETIIRNEGFGKREKAELTRKDHAILMKNWFLSVGKMNVEEIKLVQYKKIDIITLKTNAT